jgi:hypothetical protein
VANVGNYLSDPLKAEEKLKRIRFAAGRGFWIGHVPYSLFRSFLPENTAYITFLREPVERVLSHYHGHVRGHLMPGGERYASLAEALERGLPVLTNLATRLLCDDPFDDLSVNALEDAKRNLRHFAFVGLQERFDESVVLLHRLLGLEQLTPYGEVWHATGARPRAATISESERQLILERNQLDEALYLHARELFDAATAPREQLDADIQRFRAMCAVALNDYRDARRRAALWLERELLPGTMREAAELIAAAKAADIEHRPLMQELAGMRRARRMVVFVKHAHGRFSILESGRVRHDHPNMLILALHEGGTL